jgi:PAS domain S-box-containing protein
MEKTRILIVEDEAIIAMEIESQLHGLGYQVTSIVDTGEKAIKKAEEDRPDIILMDIRIKGEMDGIDAAEEIRNRFGIPVIFSTAYLDEERIERAKITMPFGYVLKPVQERDLKVTIEMALYVSKVDAERRKAEKIIFASEKELGDVLNNTVDTIYKLNLNTSTYDYMSPSSLKTYGYSPEEFISQGIEWTASLIHPDDMSSLQKHIEKLLSKTVEDDMTPILEYRFNHKELGYRWISDTRVIIFDENKNPISIVGNSRDITERKKAEEALKKSEHRLSTHIELTPLGVIEFDNEFKAISWNPGAEKIFGFTKEEAIGKNSLDLLVPDTDYETVKKIHLWQNPKAGENINDNKTKDGRIIICHWFNTPMYDIHGNVTGMTAVCQDITEKLKAEQTLKEREEWFFTILKSIGDAVITTGINGNITH